MPFYKYGSHKNVIQLFGKCLWRPGHHSKQRQWRHPVSAQEKRTYMYLSCETHIEFRSILLADRSSEQCWKLLKVWYFGDNDCFADSTVQNDCPKISANACHVTCVSQKDRLHGNTCTATVAVQFSLSASPSVSSGSAPCEYAILRFLQCHSLWHWQVQKCPCYDKKLTVLLSK